MAISTLDEILATIPNDDNRARMVDVLVWVGLTYPELELRIAWNQPMFTHHGTYIIGFSAASKHMAMAPSTPPLSALRRPSTCWALGCWGSPVSSHGRPPFAYQVADLYPMPSFHHHACRRCAWALLG